MMVPVFVGMSGSNKARRMAGVSWHEANPSSRAAAVLSTKFASAGWTMRTDDAKKRTSKTGATICPFNS